MTEFGDYSAYEIMSAPNRYRVRFLRPRGNPDGSDGMLWFFAAADDAKKRDAALAMMREDWPDKADRAVGMEPSADLCDVVLIWERAKMEDKQ